METDVFMWFLCGCYFIGGLGIGYLYNEWKHRKKGFKTGMGRWDYKDRHLGDGFN